jgi:hypothetical protein
MYNNHIIRWLTRFTTPIGKGCMPSSWESTAGLTIQQRWRKGSGTKEEEGERVWFGTVGGHRRKSMWRSKRGRKRSGDDRSNKVDEVIGAGSGGGCSGDE